MNEIIQGDSLSVLKTLPTNSIDMCITSPPYWALRDYGVEGQLGLEPTFQEYINKLCDIFDGVKRVLKDDGTCWVNMGDTYSNNSSVSERGRQGFGKDKIGMRNNKAEDVQQKSLCQIPARFAIRMTDPRYSCHCGWSGDISQCKIAVDTYCPVCGDKALKEDGWILRNTLIWHKPNCMPSSVSDRFTVDFEYLYFFAKQKKYYFEQQFDRVSTPPDSKAGQSFGGKKNNTPYLAKSNKPGKKWEYSKNRNKRCVWKVTTKPYAEAHFATYPEELIIVPIKAGCPEGGTVLDPFMGSGTTALVARKLQRNYIGIELNIEYIKIANKRIEREIGTLL